MTEDYFAKLKEQKRSEFNWVNRAGFARAKALEAKKERFDKAREKVIPRYLRRALYSGDLGRIEACIDKALDDGWEREELEDAVNLLAAQVAAGEAD